MNESDLPDDALDALLRLGAPEPLPDDGFVARTMAAVERAARAQPVQRRATPPAPLAIARALAAEQQRHDAQARLWRWATLGVVAGYLLMLLAVWLSPRDEGSLVLPTTSEIFPLGVLLAVGSIWIAVRQLRSA